MANRQLLYRISRGEYVIAPRASFTAEQAAPAEFLAALRLRAQGDYYLSYLTGLIAHRLTDMHSSTLYAAIPQDSGFRRGHAYIGSYTLKTVRVVPRRWPAAEEIDQVRLGDDTIELYRRAGIERTLLDALYRPDCSAGFETVVEAWVRARPIADWERLCRYTEPQGPAIRRRAAFMLRLIGLDDIVTAHLPVTGRGASVPLDRSDSFNLPDDARQRDTATGVILNVPADYLRGWAASVNIG